jgi:hypothetical protein
VSRETDTVSEYRIQVQGQIPDSEGLGYWSILKEFTTNPPSGRERTEQETLQAARAYAERARKTLRYVMLWRDGHEIS